MRKLPIIVLMVALVTAPAYAQRAGVKPVLFQEEDGSPAVRFKVIKVPNDSLTDNEDGSGSLDFGSVNWDEIPIIDSTGINWESIQSEELFEAGINWTDALVPDTSINWDAFPNDQGYITELTSVNWDAIVNEEIFEAGINWTDAIVPDTSINWDYLEDLDGSRINWESIIGEEIYEAGINWTDAMVPDTSINWDYIEDLDTSQINWESVIGEDIYEDGINWTDALVPDTSINWDYIEDLDTSQINWESIINEEIYEAGINWTDVVVPDSAINWDLSVPLYEDDPVAGAVSGILKADGAGNVSAAVDGTDYLAPTRIDDTKGDGDTDYVWSADKSFDQFALKGAISGQAWTGTHNFGGADDLEIPNGSSPTVDTLGQIALDSTSDQLIYYGAAKRVLTYVKEPCRTLEDPVDADDDVPVWAWRNASTITDVYCRTSGGGSINLVITDGTNDMETIACDADGQEDDGSPTNNTFTSLEPIYWDLGAPSGTVDWLMVCPTRTITAD